MDSFQESEYWFSAASEYSIYLYFLKCPLPSPAIKKFVIEEKIFNIFCEFLG